MINRAVRARRMTWKRFCIPFAWEVAIFARMHAWTRGISNGTGTVDFVTERILMGARRYGRVTKITWLEDFMHSDGVGCNY